MLQRKDITKIWELKTDFTPRWLEPDFISSSLKSFSFSHLCSAVSQIKQKGYSFEWIMTVLLSLPFISGSSIHSMLSGCVKHHIEAGKDVFYRLKNHAGINWRVVLWLFAGKFRDLVSQSSTNVTSPRCMILDDTLISKSGKQIENVSRTWDHVFQRYVFGFKLLVLGYWDGVSFLPLDFSFHREKGKNKEKPYGLTRREYKQQYKKHRDKESCSRERAEEVDRTKVSSGIKMFLRAVSMGFKVDYLLVDSWFTCDEIVKAVSGIKKRVVHLIGMYKTPKTKFTWRGGEYTYNQIRGIAGKAKRCRSLGLHYIGEEVLFRQTPAMLFFSRNGKNGKWRVFLCTDTSLSFKRMIEIYQIRWTIEVFNKEAKQLLGLGKCQSNDFDA